MWTGAYLVQGGNPKELDDILEKKNKEFYLRINVGDVVLLVYYCFALPHLNWNLAYMRFKVYYLKMSFYDGSLNREELKKFIQKRKTIRYTMVKV